VKNSKTAPAAPCTLVHNTPIITDCLLHLYEM